jgi:GT2 family glycosyltransferase/glycosyltransferase involved in cell wall biosynthesis
MRVLLVVHGFPPAARGGTELYAAAHATQLHEQFGDEVIVLAGEHDPRRPEYALRSERRDGVRIVRVNNTFRSTASFAESYDNPAIGKAAERLIDECSPEVAHVHHLTGLSTTIVRSLAERAIPCYATLHDYWLICHRGQLLDLDGRVCEGPEHGCRRCVGAAGASSAAMHHGARLFRAVEARTPLPDGIRRAGARLAAWIGSDEAAAWKTSRRVGHMRALCGAVTRFFAPSRAIRDRFVQFGVPVEKITLAPYGIDPRPFAGRQRSASECLRIGFVGSLMMSKAPHLVIEAAARLPRGRVRVELFGAYAAYHGDGAYRTVIDEAKRREFVTSHEAIPHDQIPQALANLDVLVVPSIWPENSPFVIQEAALARVPVVASRIGGIPELVADESSGLLFEPGNAADLAAKLQRLIDDPPLLDRLRAAVPAVRTLDEDVRFTRSFYATANSAAATGRAVLSNLAAVVVNYRTPEQTAIAIRSLAASNRAVEQLIVIDNAGDGRAGAALGNLSPRVVYERTGRNLGFSGGVNVGIRRALDGGADAVLLVNSDTIVPPDCIGKLIELLHSASDVGIVGPLLVSRSNPDRIASAGLTYSVRTGRMRQLHEGAPAGAHELRPRVDVDAVSGCVMLVRRAVFDAIGLLDERFFYSFEDLDFCLRARAAGFRTALAGTAVAYHEGGGSIGAAASARLYFAARNHLLLAARIGPPGRTVAAATRTATIVMLNAAHAVRVRPGSLPARLQAVARGVRDYALGRFGPGPQLP